MIMQGLQHGLTQLLISFQYNYEPILYCFRYAFR